MRGLDSCVGTDGPCEVGIVRVRVGRESGFYVACDGWTFDCVKEGRKEVVSWLVGGEGDGWTVMSWE